MTKSEVLEILKHISDSDEKCAMDVVYALSLLSTNFGKMLDSIKDQMVDALAQNQFGDINRLNLYCDNITELKAQIEECIGVLVKESTNAQIASEVTTVAGILDSSVGNGLSPCRDYSRYEVDRLEAHYLDEEFTKTRICGFAFRGKHYSVKNWNSVLVKLCEILYRQDPAMIESFVDNPAFTQKVHKYFDTKPAVNHNGRKENTQIKGSGIFVWTHFSAKSIVHLIKEILYQFGIDQDEVLVYLRADYSELHAQTASESTKVVSIMDSSVGSGSSRRDYSRYEVDRLEVHYLDDEFTNKKICGFVFQGKHYSEKNWNSVLVKFCEILYWQNPAMIESFVENPIFTQKVHKYFDTKPVVSQNGYRQNTQIKGSGVFVWTHLSVKSIVHLIKEILYQFRIDQDEFLVNLRAD